MPLLPFFKEFFYSVTVMKVIQQDLKQRINTGVNTATTSKNNLSVLSVYIKHQTTF